MKRVDYNYFLLAMLLLGMMATCLPSQIQAKPQAGTDLIIVGLLDGPLSGTPKFLELYVVNDIPDLSIFGIGSANNGGGTDGQEWTFPADPATAGSTIYVANDTAAFRTFMGYGANYQDGGAACNFNGDDAFELFENGTVVDIFGDINVDGTGTPWEYLDSWVKRVNATGPDGTSFVQSNWTYGPINVFDGTTTNASASSPYPTAAYMPGGSSGGSIGSIDLILKGVIYASATIKATEFEVLNDIPDLSIYGIGTTNNGGGSDSVEWSFPAATATAGDRIYVARDSAAFNQFFGFDANYYDPTGDAHNFNGDDGIEIFKNGNLTEIFGDTLLDGTGEPWEYTDGWAHRIDGTGPDSATFVLANWEFSSLGNYVGTSDNASAPQPYPVAVMTGSTMSPALVLVGVIHANADVKSTEYYVLEDIADLSIYGLGGANNGGGTDSVEWAFPAASASRGDRLYVTRDSATFRDFFGFDANFYDPNGDAHNFNGDDAFEVFENGVVIDLFGDINVDGTGEPWEYKESWAARECATGPDSSTFVLSSWSFGPIEIFDGIATNNAAGQPYAFGTYDTIPCPIPVGPSPTELVITEIMYNSPGSDLEYIEFYNNTTDSIDISGYSISDAISFTFPSYILPPGEIVLISDDSTAMQSFWGVTAFNWSSGSLNNSGESITLRDTAGMVIDSVFYDDVAPWTTTPDGRGPSLVLCDPDSNNNAGSNWQRAISSSGNLFDGREVFGNPGTLSSCVADPIVGIQAAEVITGEADGDLTVLFYLDNPDPNNATTLDLDIAMGGTADGSDYSFTPTTITFPAGTDTAQSTIIGITDDSDQEPEESFTLNLSNPSGNTIITNDSMRITIVDNDAPLTYSLKIIGLVHGPNSGVPKAVEILALNDIPNLSLYGLGCANNGGGTDGQEYTFPSDSIPAGTCFFVANDTAGFRAFFGFSADYQDDGSANNFNGDDAFEIYESGSVIDVFGEVDVDGTGTPWEYTLGWVHRKAGTGPDTATFVLDNWEFGGIDAFLGVSTNDAAANPYPVMMCDLVSIEPVDLKQEIRIYPNPAQFSVRYDAEVRIEKVILRNLLGQALMVIDQPADSAEIDLSPLANDIYFLSFVTEQGIWTQKLVVRK